ncbi:baeRF11 domain-containing protein [Faunimonas sp. B44]|uniref:baeRF11 domain-containing protein n=1 Tax=Faunimonas sp. B44 TaxID=3461493 RepID=UPI004043F8C3
MLYVDIPTLPEIRALHATRADACVSIYLPTTPQTQDVKASRIALGNQAKAAMAQLDAAGFDKRRRALLEAELAALGEDDEFWRLQAHSLAVLATPDNVRTFRLATAVTETVEVSDRFHLKPLLRAIAFPQHAFVLALSENAVRLVEVFADLPATHVRVPDLPKSAADAVGRASVNNLTQGTRLANAQGQTVLLRQYARQVDAALRGVLAGRETPLILAATEPLAPIFRAVNSYPALLSEGVSASPDRMSDGELAEAARAVLDGHYAAQVEAAKALFQERSGQNRATTELQTVARAATFGAVELLLVDMDETLPGTVDETDGSVSLASEAGAGSYGVIDEIAGRAIRAGAKVLAVRRADIPEEASAAAILRYPV